MEKYNEINYMGIQFLISQIEGNKVYIMDQYGNKMGWIYTKEIELTGHSFELLSKQY